MFHRTISMLRVADARASEAFFTEKLGFATSWSWDPGDGGPVFVEVTRDQVSFHLSEHEGDGPMGIQIYVAVASAPDLHADLVAKDVAIAEPLHEAEWGEHAFAIQDLDGNTLRFGSPLA